MSASIGDGNITFGDGSVQSSKSLSVSAQVFTSSGTFTIPAKAVKVTVTGGGGTGGSNGGKSCGGGGAGGTAIKWLSGLTVGSTLTVTVGSAGGNSTVASGTQTISTITGGAGGKAVALNGKTVTKCRSNFG